MYVSTDLFTLTVLVVKHQPVKKEYGISHLQLKVEQLQYCLFHANENQNVAFVTHQVQQVLSL
jgi:hypothetical protein